MSEIVFNAPSSDIDLETQVESLQTTLASLNQQIIFLQESLQEKDQQIVDAEKQLVASQASPCEAKIENDKTLTIIGALINLYRFIFLPGKVL